MTPFERRDKIHNGIGVYCWVGLCFEPHLPGEVYCVGHELLYRASTDQPSSSAESLEALNKWESDNGFT